MSNVTQIHSTSIPKITNNNSTLALNLRAQVELENLKMSHSQSSLLILPNETLDEILRLTLGEPTVETCFLPEVSDHDTQVENMYSLNPVLQLRLVCKKFSALGWFYLLYRRRIASEGRLKSALKFIEEVAAAEAERFLDPEERHKSILLKFTRQLSLQNIPLLYYLESISGAFANVTHLTLKSVRLEPPRYSTDGSLSPYECHILPSVRELCIEVTPSCEAGIPLLLQSFPNLETLALDSDPSRYPGMDTKFICTFPPLPRLKTLLRPPFKRGALPFSNHSPRVSYRSRNGYNNQGLDNTTPWLLHRHFTHQYDAFCSGCTQWLQEVMYSERYALTFLVGHSNFPSLQEVIFPRLVYTNITPLNFRKKEDEESMWQATCTERWRAQPDTVIYLLEGQPSTISKLMEIKIDDVTHQEKKFWYKCGTDDHEKVKHRTTIGPWDL